MPVATPNPTGTHNSGQPSGVSTLPSGAIPSSPVSAIVGIHPVREALLSGTPLERVVVAQGVGGPRLQEIIELAREKKLPVRFETRAALDKLAAGAKHQGVAAVGAAQRYASIADVAATASMIVALDGVEDPQNLGAIIRTVNAAGADAVLVPERRAAGLTETVARAAAGAIAYVPVIRTGNLAKALDQLKKNGFWVYGLDERGECEYDVVDYSPKSVLVLGSEGSGLHKNVKKRCDHLVGIPMAGRIASLNVSVSAGVALFEWRRRRTKAK